MKIFKLWKSCLHLFYPELCMGCSDALLEQEELICSSCLYHLPWTDFHLDNNNETMQLLKGKFPFVFACSMLYLSPESSVEQLIYNLKYKNHPQVGFSLGLMYGKKLVESRVFEEIDILVPIPLHAKRLRKRGYNQSEYFAKGLAKALGKDVDVSLLKRKKYQTSQTKMAAVDRYQNVAEAFSCVNPQKETTLNILLVDDVLTTGATITAAVECLLKEMPQCKIYIATIARA